ncbi:MAG: hypothetical protein KGL39_21240 [Patescibacteria group bacterium]|nr:hypothetical protein [Patescibacteria group bacterium]
MSTPFFITGLPRTRSAWLANLFTTEHSLCFHDPQETVTELLARNEGMRVGVADSTLVFKAHALLDRYPDAPWLFVDRKAEDCRRSLVKFTRETTRLMGRDIDAVFQAHAAASSVVKAWRGTLVVPFRALDARMPEIWAHLLPGLEYQWARHRLLQDMKVEQNLPKLYAERMGR